MSALRVLLVEDEMLIAMDIEDMLVELGFDVVGPAPRLHTALKLAREAPIDLAVLDVNLAGERSFPVADVLRARGIPFLFATGYGPAGLTGDYASEITLQKPLEQRLLSNALATLR